MATSKDSRNSNDDDSRSFLKLLDEQYDLVEVYANAQTLLYNAAVAPEPASATAKSRRRLQLHRGAFDGEFPPPPNPAFEAIERLGDAKTNLRSNFERLTAQASNTRHSDHLSLSQRVVGTIFGNPAWHSNGLPNVAGRRDPSGEALQANTVAIAALNASIARLKDIEG